jgi:hypothetical protein
VEDIGEPEIVVIDDLSFVAESSMTFLAAIGLYSVFDPLFNRLRTTAIGAKVPVF